MIIKNTPVFHGIEAFDKCVYLHKDSNGVVKYVGHGNKDRPFEHSQGKRSKLWYDVFKDTNPAVEIVATNLSYSQAVQLQNDLIKAHKETIVNTSEITPPPYMDFEWFDEWFYVDESSPSGLRWKKQRPRSKMYSGDQAGSLLTKETGKLYWQIKVGRKVYKVHRVVYLLTHGTIDEGLVIDHIDGNGLNNNINNLRLVPHFVNCMNKAVSKTKEFNEKNISETKRSFHACFEFLGKVYNFRIRKDDFDNNDAALEHIKNLVETKRIELYKEKYV